MIEYPPLLIGTPQNQLCALRDYLVRMAQELSAAETASTSAAPLAAGDRGTAKTEEKEELLRTAQRLRGLVLKTADQVHRYVDSTAQTLRESCLARSEFGTFTETLTETVTATARGVVESYDYDEAIEALDALAGENRQYITTLNGEIRRGILVDPETGLPELGIAISENLSFTGETVTEGGLVYYRIAPGQTFGLYTATGWQFWVNGAKAGWFSSEDGMLHVTNIVTENSFSLGAEWAFSTAGGFGIRYTG